jgi:hypothetical protein
VQARDGEQQRKEAEAKNKASAAKQKGEGQVCATLIWACAETRFFDDLYTVS